MQPGGAAGAPFFQERSPMADTVKASANLTDTNSAEARARRRREKQANLSASEKLKSNATVVVAVIAGVITSLVKFVAASITGSATT